MATQPGTAGTRARSSPGATRSGSTGSCTRSASGTACSRSARRSARHVARRACRLRDGRRAGGAPGAGRGDDDADDDRTAVASAYGRAGCGRRAARGGAARRGRRTERQPVAAGPAETTRTENDTVDTHPIGTPDTGPRTCAAPYPHDQGSWAQARAPDRDGGMNATSSHDRGLELLAAHCASLDPASETARERLDEALGPELARKLVFALSCGGTHA